MTNGVMLRYDDWQNVYVFVNLQAFLVQNVQPLHDYKSHADNYICSLIPGNPSSSAQYTPGCYKIRSMVRFLFDYIEIIIDLTLNLFRWAIVQDE